MILRLTLATTLLVALPAGGHCQDEPDLRAKLARLPRPWTQQVRRFSRDEYQATLRFWAEKHRPWAELEQVGQSQTGLPIYLLRITDQQTDDAGKQVCLITSLHGGPERSGTTTIMHLIEWLLGDSPEATETRRRQIVLLMPIINPHAFFVSDRFGNEQGIDPYTGGGTAELGSVQLDLSSFGPMPEVKAFLSVVDRFRPEMHVDVHGTGLQEYREDQLGGRTRYQGQTMFEVTGSAYSNYALRPWDWRVTEALITAGVEAGYPSDRFEADAQRGYWGPAMQPLHDRLWRGRPNFYTAQYAYARYHTMLAALEVGWEDSGLARLQRMLRIGNEAWQGEPAAGYPVDRVKSFIGHFVTAWGRTAAERRQSRCQLWQQQGRFTQAVLYPQTDGRDTYLVALDNKGAELLDLDPAKWIVNLGDLPDVQADAVAAFVAAGPEIKLAIDARPAGKAEPSVLDSGLGLRLRLPYRQPTIVDLRLNGHVLNRSRDDGYESWHANGFTHVQIHVPPAKLKHASLLVVTCAYLPDVKRRYGWIPPREVLKRLGRQ